MSDQGFWSLAALFFFTTASFGFVYFMIRYPRGSEVQLWGIRICHVMGFIGVLMLRIWRGSFNEVSLLIVSALVVSTLGFELSVRFLKEKP